MNWLKNLINEYWYGMGAFDVVDEEFLKEKQDD